MLIVDKTTGFVYLNDTKLAELGGSELLVFDALCHHVGAYLSKEQLLAVGWPSKVVTNNSLAVAIKNLRRVISSADDISQYVSIETKHKVGYRLLTVNDWSVQNNIMFCEDYLANLSRERRAESEVIEFETVESEIINDVTDEPLLESVVSRDETFANAASVKKINNRPKAVNLWIKNYVWVVLLGLLFITFHSYLSESKTYCYKISVPPDIKACGASSLSKVELEKVKGEILKLDSNNQININTGLVIYGYQKYKDNIGVYVVR